MHYNQVLTHINVQPNSQYHLTWQGCSEDGLCYPAQRKIIQTNTEGLLAQQHITQGNHSRSLLSNQTSTPDIEQNNTLNTELKAGLNSPIRKQTENKAPNRQEKNPAKPSLSDQPATTVSQQVQEQQTPSTTSAQLTEQFNSPPLAPSSVQSQSANKSLSHDWNSDQFFLNLLSSQNVFLNIIIFLGLGVLLAFLPCSLPLIPILSGILVQRNKGYKAAVIALTFIVNMAFVYGLMGLVVSHIGYNVQRWFQNPLIIGLFAVLFVVFALNLFGLYQLSLPQGILQRLDRIQQRQQGGTLLGAGIMGAISALIVGPCMSAPLAGALLYVSQLEQTLLAGLYLFLLGLGIGIPLFIASVFGAKFLPNPGLWMDRLKFSFGFVMLLLATYFARPLLSLSIYHLVFALILIFMAAYLIAILRHVVRIPHQLLIVVLSCVLAASGVWHLTQTISNVKQQTTHLHPWIVVKNQQELEAALKASSPAPIIIDVYADWCVACQPIERDVLPLAEVQDALKDVTRIKLDLTTYQPSQDIILKQRQILGPPTMLFLKGNQNEQRSLRLTGTYNAAQLISNIKQLHEETD